MIVSLLLLYVTLWAQKPLEKVSLQLQYLDQFQFAGYYMAIEKGFYKNAGLDVTLKPYNPEIIPIDEVLEGRADYGIGRSSILVEIARGKKLHPLAAIFQSSPQILITTPRSDIHTLQDIKGKHVMITQDSLEGVTLQAMLNSQGIYNRDFKTIKHDYNLQNLIDGKVDVMSAYISNEPYTLQQKGIEPIIFHPKVYGFDFYEDILFTGEKELKNHPKRVDAFLQASLQGWEYAFSHIQESVDVILKKYNTQHKERSALLYEAKKLKELAYEGDSKLGEMTREKWQRIYDIYRVVGAVKAKVNLDAMVHKVKRVHLLLSDDEKAYLSQKHTITMCVDPDWMPYESIIKNQHVGIAADIIKIISKKLKTSIVLIPTKSWDESITYAKERKCDIMPILMPTQSRKKFLKFTDPYLSFPFVIATSLDKVFVDDKSGIENKKIAIVKNYAIGEVLQNRYANIKFVEVNSIKEALEKVKNGEVFGYIDSVATIRAAIEKYHYQNSIKISGKLDEMLKLSIGVRNDDAMLFQIFSKALESISDVEKEDIVSHEINALHHAKIDYQLVWEMLILFALVISVMIWAYRKLALNKEKLEESSNNFKTLLDSTRDVVVVWDKDMKILLINKAGEDIFGYSKEEIVSMSVLDFIDESRVDVVQWIQENDSHITFEMELFSKDKREVPCLVSGRNITYQRKPARVSIITNLTDIKRAQQKLLDVNHSLEERVAQEVENNRQKDKQMLEQSRLAQMGEMISMIAHQWRQPLGAIAATGIDMKMSMMMQKYNLEKSQEREAFELYMEKSLDDIESYVQNLTETIDDFRNFYKPNKERENVAIHLPYEKSRDILKGTLAAHSIMIEESLKSEKTLALFNNELMQVYLNILKNAIDNFKEKEISDPTIMIRSEDTKKGAKLTICDNGGGIPKKIIKKIFDPYFSTKDEKNGTGLGLYMSKIIVEEHHKGRLVAQNSDKGVCFSIEIFA